ATFTWSAAEVRELLDDDAPLFTATYGVRDEGNWEGRTILSRIQPAAGDDGVVDPGRESRLAAARERLLARRATRPQPARDDKALAAWNGLAIAALADAARLLPEPDADRYRAAAITAADTILTGLRRPDGRLGRSWKDGRSSGEGVLEDYADLADGLLALYDATFDERWFTIARELADTILERFADPAGGFFDTADDHEALVTRPKDPQDNATPSGGSMATIVLLRLAALTGEDRYLTTAERAIATVTPFLGRYPTGFANWLSAASLAVGGIVELAIAGDPADPATRTLIDVARSGARPDLVVAVTADPSASVIPLLADRVTIDGRPTAYVCRRFACRLPVTDPGALAAQLAEPVTVG
ncbi:MAG TPA: thioredoxin domain-containing protein, partial [Verrucomicrobiae bacterium]|nr:thioredoxin domain-containing protein [Verrucomicrobiae bacterium]